MQRFVTTSFLFLFALTASALGQQQDSQQQNRNPSRNDQATERQERKQERQQAERQEEQQRKQFAEQQRSKNAAKNIKAEHVFRSSNLSGMNVMNQQGEELGEIKELVIDIESGKVVYAAMSVGGVLGIGDKLFAVPWKALTFKHGEDDQHFVLAMDKKRLENAKGFDQDHWPDVANDEWSAENEKFYETATRSADEQRSRR